MREICESVAGEEDLFSIFMRVFCGNSGSENEEETAAIEKWVLFSINLISYFYNGGTLVSIIRLLLLIFRVSSFSTVLQS